MSKNIFEIKWIKEMKSKLMFLHKDWDEEKVEKELENIVWENLKDVPCEVINTYKCRKVDSTLLNMMQFIHDMKPIIGGFGVLYKNQNGVELCLRELLKKQEESQTSEGIRLVRR